MEDKAFFKPDGELVKALIARLMTRNTVNPIERNADRLQFLANVSNFAQNPPLHLGFCCKLIEQYALQGKQPTFEIGLVMGAAMVFCCHSRENEKILQTMLSDIEKQQEEIKNERDQSGESKKIPYSNEPKHESISDC